MPEVIFFLFSFMSDLYHLIQLQLVLTWADPCLFNFSAQLTFLHFCSLSLPWFCLINLMFICTEGQKSWIRKQWEVRNINISLICSQGPRDVQREMHLCFFALEKSFFGQNNKRRHEGRGWKRRWSKNKTGERKERKTCRHEVWVVYKHVLTSLVWKNWKRV